MGYGKLPVCIAKTQYSFSTNPDLKGAPVDHMIPVREVRLSAGALLALGEQRPNEGTREECEHRGESGGKQLSEQGVLPLHR